MNKNCLEKYYVERDISWMYFNERILQEAEKKNIPLLERFSESIPIIWMSFFGYESLH